MNRVAAASRWLLRGMGWELHRADPGRSLGEHLWHLFPYLRINCVLDIGAGSGEYGQFLRENGYQGRIISFEAAPASFEALERRRAGDPNWQTYQYAIGCGRTASRLRAMANCGTLSFLRPTVESVATTAVAECVRPDQILRLDEVFDDVVVGIGNARVFVKLGAQEQALDVLHGAERRLHMIRAVQAELAVLPLANGAVDFTEALSQFTRAGFALTGFFNLPHHQEFRLLEFDCVMIHTPDVGRVQRRW